MDYLYRALRVNKLQLQVIMCMTITGSVYDSPFIQKLKMGKTKECCQKSV